MKASSRSKALTHSLTRALFNEAKRFNDVIDLTLGDPDFDTPELIKDAGIKAIRENRTHYSANAGIIQAREVVANRAKSIWGISCDPNTNVILTVGGMEALYLALLSLVDVGDEVILFAPYYVNYYQIIQMCGGKPVVIDAYNTRTGMSVNQELLESKVTDRTSAIIVNTPNNPTGSIMPMESLKSIAKVAEKHDLAIISDEVYRTFVYDGDVHQSILQFNEARKQTVLIDSLSKEFSMTGWRIGYAIAPAEIIDAMVKFQENVAACAAVPSQYALIEAYSTAGVDKQMLHDFQNRRDLLFEALSGVQGLDIYKPKGAFYLFVNISKLNIGSEEFAHRLLKTKHVAVVPGKAYGDNYDGYIRIAFTKNIETLKVAAARVSEFADELWNASRGASETI